MKRFLIEKLGVQVPPPEEVPETAYESKSKCFPAKKKSLTFVDFLRWLFTFFDFRWPSLIFAQLWLSLTLLIFLGKQIENPTRIYEPNPNKGILKKFLENDKKVLRFYCYWDNRDALFGERLPYVKYYLKIAFLIYLYRLCITFWWMIQWK